MATENEIKKEFLNELKNLLIKYNASIEMFVDGDLTGIGGVQMEIWIGQKRILELPGEWAIEGNSY